MELRSFNSNGGSKPSGLKLKIKGKKDKSGYYLTHSSPVRGADGEVVLNAQGRPAEFKDDYICKFFPSNVELVEEDGTPIEMRDDFEVRFEVVKLVVKNAVGTDWAEWRKQNPNGSTKGKTAKAKPADAPAEEKTAEDGATPYDP